MAKDRVTSPRVKRWEYVWGEHAGNGAKCARDRGLLQEAARRASTPGSSCASRT
jgi:hypothetical protein